MARLISVGTRDTIGLGKSIAEVFQLSIGPAVRYVLDNPPPADTTESQRRQWQSARDAALVEIHHRGPTRLDEG